MTQARHTGSERSQLIGQFSAETFAELDRMDEWEIELLEANPEISLQANASRMAAVLKSRKSTFEVFRDAVFYSPLGATANLTDVGLDIALDEYLKAIWLAAPVEKDPSIFCTAASSIDSATVKTLKEHLFQAPGPREAKLLVAVLLVQCEAAGSFETIAKTNELATAIAEHMDDVDRGLEIAQEAGMLRVSQSDRRHMPVVEIGGWFWQCLVAGSQIEAREALILPDDILYSDRLPDETKQLYEYLISSTDYYKPGNSEAVYLIAMDNEVGGSERTYDLLQPLVALGLVEQDSHFDADEEVDVSRLYYRLVSQPDRVFAADLLDLFRFDAERIHMDEARSREVHSEKHIDALAIVRELAEVIFLEEWGDKISGGAARLAYAREDAAEKIQSWVERGGEAMDWTAATEWMIERMASGLNAEGLEELRKQMAEMAESKQYDRSTMKEVEDGLVFQEWLHYKYPHARKSNARFWRSDRYEPYPMPDFRL